MPRVAVLFVYLLESWEVFLCLVPGFANTFCTGKGGDRVDADGNPLLQVLFWQKAVFFGRESATRPRLTPTCLWHRNVKDAAFCR